MNLNAEDSDPFYGLETEYFQTKYYKEHLGLVVSQNKSNSRELYNIL